VANRVLILENAYYSVISPEGCAAILWKDRTAAAKAAEALKITAKHLLDLGLVDEIIPEPLGGAHSDPEQTAENLKSCLLRHLEELQAMTPEARREQRYAKFRNFGHFLEKTAPTPEASTV
jgi:acetyl-CoA carboxylase carboxyl transferase subunit alpha